MTTHGDSSGSETEAMQAKFVFSRARAQEICITDEAYLPQGHPSPDPGPQRIAPPLHPFPARIVPADWKG